MQSVDSILAQQCLNEIMNFDIRFPNCISEDWKRSHNCFYKENLQNQFGLLFFLTLSYEPIEAHFESLVLPLSDVMNNIIWYMICDFDLATTMLWNLFIVHEV